MSEHILQGNLVYSSENILERRRKILRTARSMVAKHGYDGFGIRELCVKASVAPQTVYKAFGSKERLIALAIRDQFSRFVAQQSYTHALGTLMGVVERLTLNDERMAEHKEFVSALVALHFSQTTDNDLREASRQHIMNTLQPWAAALERSRKLRPGVDAEGFVNDLVNLLFAVSLEWCRGKFRGKLFLREKLRVLLIHTAGATTGAARKEAEALLKNLPDPGKLLETTPSLGGVAG